MAKIARDSAPPAFDREGVATTYEDWYASGFGRYCDRRETQALAQLLAPVARGERILDLGCGTGHFSRALTRLGYSVFGADRSDAMLARAQPGAQVRAAAESLPFARDSFAAVVVVALLDYVDDPVRVLREAARVSRGPVVVIALQRRSSIALWRRLAARRGHAIFRQARFYTAGQLRHFFRAAGLAIAEQTTAIYLPPSLCWRLEALERLLTAWAAPGASLLAARLVPQGGPRARGSLADSAFVE